MKLFLAISVYIFLLIYNESYNLRKVFDTSLTVAMGYLIINMVLI